MNMNTKHTPGPWSYDSEGYVYGGEQGLIITDPSCSNPDISADQNEANARLIAAAPELLTALENVIQFHYGNKGLRGECDHIGWVRVARAAIAKATGGES